MTALLSLVGLVTAALVAIVLRRRRASSPVARALSVVMLAGTSWTSMAALSAWVDGPFREVTIGLSTAGTGVVAMATLWYSLVVSGHTTALSARARAVLTAEPLALALLVLVPATRALVLTKVEVVDGALRMQVGPALWVHAAVGFGAIAGSVVLHAMATRSAVPAHRHLHWVSLVGILVPALGAAVTLARAGTSLYDYGAATFALPAAAWLWMERYTESLGTVPITTAQVLQALPDAVVVSDPQGRIVSANDAALELLRARQPERVVVGARWSDLVAPELYLRMQQIDHETLSLGGGRTLDVRVTRLAQADGTSQATVAVVRDVTEVERLRSELAELAVRDGLTGLHNRRHLDRVAGRLVAAAHRSGEPLTAVMVDVDHFKQVNDTHGHALGDDVLVAISRELAGCLRPHDVLVRFGGEEFLALVPGAAPHDVASRLEECRRRIAEMRWRTPADELALTISCGIAGLASDADVDALLLAADRALYRAKAAGRDRVVAAGG